MNSQLYNYHGILMQWYVLVCFRRINVLMYDAQVYQPYEVAAMVHNLILSISDEFSLYNIILQWVYNTL